MTSLFLPVFRLCFERFQHIVNMEKHLPNCPSLDPATHKFEEQFPSYFFEEECVQFAAHIRPIAQQFEGKAL